MLNRLVLFATLICVSAAFASNDHHDQDGDDGHRVEICHKDKHVIHVDEHAVPAHLDHGDCLGSCPL
jgi:hypothetical protein